MWILCVLTIIVFESCFFVGAERPDFIKPCHVSAPDFRQCCIDHGNEALPFLLQGDKKFKIPNMLPIKFPEVDVHAGPNLKITLKDVSVYGLDTIKVVDMIMDPNKKFIDIKLQDDYATLIGQYDVDGKILVLPLTGNGPFNITVTNNTFEYSVSYKLEQKNGMETAKLLDNDNLDFTIGKAYFNLENLFNGNKVMGDHVNQFLNENEKEVTKELSGAVSGTISAIARNIAQSVVENIAWAELFLP